MHFDAELILTKTKGGLLVKKRFFNGEVEARFCYIIRSFELYFSDSSLKDMDNNFNKYLSSALYAVALLKVNKKCNDRISPLLQNSSVNEIKKICRAAEKNMEENQTHFTMIYTKKP